MNNELKLVPGEILKLNISTRDGLLLTPKGTLVTAVLIERLKNFKINENGIAEPVAPAKEGASAAVPKEEVKKSNEIKLDSAVVGNALGSVKNMFEENLGGTELSELAAENAVNIVEAIQTSNIDACICIQDLRQSDEYTYQHSVDVAVLATVIGRLAGYDADGLAELAQAGLLHDIGKRTIPDQILNKAGRLTDQEMEIVKQHSQRGFDIIKDIPGISNDVKKAVLQHHEKMDGTGYPLGRTGAEINKYAQILTIADVYDALTHKRVYKPSMSAAEAFGIMVRSIGGDNKELFLQFFNHLVFYPINSKVILNNGKIAIVIDNKNNREPIVVTAERKVIDLHADKTNQIFGAYSESMMDKWRNTQGL